MDSQSRRSVLRTLGAALGVAAIDWPQLAQAAHDAHRAAQGVPTGYQLLVAADVADLDALTAQIIPTDDTPGAREAGVIYFIDRALGTFMSQLAGDYRAQLAVFQAGVRRQHPDAASFAALTAEQQIAFLKTVDRTPFFETTRLLTLLGMFTLPVYGGNRDGIGWKLIGFEDAHVFQPPFGYYDRDYPGFVADTTNTK
jgi:gluconate 2-dehydrogenase gamma chain